MQAGERLGGIGTASLWNVPLSYTRFGLNRAIGDSLVEGGDDLGKFGNKDKEGGSTVSTWFWKKNIGFQKTRHCDRFRFAGHSDDILFVHLHT